MNRALIPLLPILILSGCGGAAGPPANGAGNGQLPGSDTAAPADGAGGYDAGARVQFVASYRTQGAMLARSEPKELNGTLRVGEGSARLDLPVHFSIGHAVHLIHDGEELWLVDAPGGTFRRMTAGDWETKVFPRLLDTGDVEDIGKGRCPFGSARSGDCAKLGTEEVAGRSAERWTYKKREIWLDPRLRVALREVFRPFFKKDDTQVVELGEIRTEPQDPGQFLIQKGLECTSGSFCESAPVAP